jgi:hypothetical protein
LYDLIYCEGCRKTNLVHVGSCDVFDFYIFALVCRGRMIQSFAAGIHLIWKSDTSLIFNTMASSRTFDALFGKAEVNTMGYR